MILTPPPPPTQRKAEEALLGKTVPLEVVYECLALREQRVSIDLVRDDVEGQLNKVGAAV